MFENPRRGTLGAPAFSPHIPKALFETELCMIYKNFTDLTKTNTILFLFGASYWFKTVLN